jgi:undecaprenyl-diphosphatase
VPILEAIILGVVQGLTEFLPVSSSGHLLIVPWLFGWDSLESDSVKKSFDVALHLGTLLAVVSYFRSDLVGYVCGGVTAVVRRDRPVTEEGRIAWLLVLSAVPAGVVGFAARGFIVDTLGSPLVIALSLIGFGLLLMWADRSMGARSLDELRTRDSLFVGAAQVLALNPGTSRSGITMTAARRAGFSRDGAARLSFLMSLPVTGGAVVFELLGLAADGVPEGLILPMVIGVITSAIAGWVAVWGTIRIVRTHSFIPFVVYRVGLGLLVLVLLATGVRSN